MSENIVVVVTAVAVEVAVVAFVVVAVVVAVVAFVVVAVVPVLPAAETFLHYNYCEF